MMTTLQFLKDNIVWLKDVFTILFTATGTIISILAYRRARATVLQPIRNEVVKKQSEILTKLLDFIAYPHSFLHIDSIYVELIEVNSFDLLRKYGIPFEKNERIDSLINESGIIVCKNGTIPNNIRTVETFEQHTNILNCNTEKLEIKVNNLFITKGYREFNQNLLSYVGNPFIPKNISNAIEKLSKDIEINISTNMKNVLFDFLQIAIPKFTETNKLPYNPMGIYNEFNQIKIDHQKSINDLKTLIRKYMRIDEKW